MTATITIMMHRKEVEFDLNDNKITFISIKSAYLLSNEAVVALTYEIKGRRKYCQSRVVPEPYFLLPAGWPTIKFNVESDHVPSRPSTSVDQGASQPKRQKVDFGLLPVDMNLAAFIGKYALFYHWKDDKLKKCAIPLTTKLATTHRHGSNRELKIGDKLEIHSWADATFKVATHVVRILEDLDTVILQSDVEICKDDLVFNSATPQKGMRYTLMGFSIRHGGTNRQSLSTGIITSNLRANNQYAGTSGSFKGNSGASCWTEDGRLLGMQLAVEVVPHTSNNGRPSSHTVGGRICWFRRRPMKIGANNKHIVLLRRISMCAIRMIAFEPEEPFRFLSSMHLFHQVCVDQWLMKSFTCPPCLEPIDSTILSSLTAHNIESL